MVAFHCLPHTVNKTGPDILTTQYNSVTTASAHNPSGSLPITSYRSPLIPPLNEAACLAAATGPCHPRAECSPNTSIESSIVRGGDLAEPLVLIEGGIRWVTFVAISVGEVKVITLYV